MTYQERLMAVIRSFIHKYGQARVIRHWARIERAVLTMHNRAAH